MLKRLIASAALAATLGAGSLAFVGTAPASAEWSVWPDVTITPAQEQLTMFNAYVYGVTTGATVTCYEMHVPANANLFPDCQWMLGPYYYYSFPILQWWSYYGYTVQFGWNAANNQYLGYTVFK